MINISKRQLKDTQFGVPQGLASRVFTINVFIQ